MAFPLPQPFISAPTAEGQLEQLKAYLFQLINQLQWSLESLEKGRPEVVKSISSTREDEWSYVKYSDNTYRLQGVFSITPSGSSKSDAWYRTTRISLNVPFAIKSAIVVGNTNGYSVLTNAAKHPDRDDKIAFRLLSDKDLTNTTVKVRLLVVGQYQ